MEGDWATSFAFAKINLALAVVGRRRDGYHELQSVMQSIALHDVIRVRRAAPGIVCRCGELSGSQNLAYRAAGLFLERHSALNSGINSRDQRSHTGAKKENIHSNLEHRIRSSESSICRLDERRYCPPDSIVSNLDYGVEIEIEKNIPWQAGLGGGSSDAATTLVLLNEVFQRPFTYDELIDMAVRCGADVAFCLRGGTQWAEGIGERLQMLPPVPRLDLVLVKPPLGVDTGQAYRMFDQEGKFGQLSRLAWKHALGKGNVGEIASLMQNDLERVSIDMVPAIGRIKRELMEAGCLGTLMAGSGSAVFGIAAGPQHAAAIAERMQHGNFGQVWVTSTMNDDLFAGKGRA